MLQIQAIPGFTDNYFWLLSHAGYAGAAVVDPGDAAPVLRRLQALGLQLETILITHKHADHIGGIPALKAAWPNAVVYGPQDEPIQQLEQRVGQGDTLTSPGLHCSLQVLDVPGHTEGHIAYYSPGSLFCGDTLFAGGCGRVFSGTFAQLHAALQQLAALPPETQVFCAHEYTQDNLGFAAWVEPDNVALRERIQQVDHLRANNQATVPSTLAVELVTNPFLRTTNASVIRAAEAWAGHALTTSAAVFQALRTWKDKEYD